MTKRKKRFFQKQDPVLTAIKQGNLGLVQNVINKTGWNFSKVWLEGYTLLCSAIKYNRSEIALWLISKDCKVNRNNDEGDLDTPLHLAIYNDENLIATKLLEKGADVSVTNSSGKTPLHISCEKKNTEITRLLLKDNSIVNVADIYLTTALHIAVEKECLEIVQLLLSHEANIDAYTIKAYFEGFTPLHIAVANKNEYIVQILLDNGANVNALVGISHVDGFQDNCVKYEGYTPLHLAMEMNSDNIMKLLVGYGADVDSITKDYGLTALHIAIQNRNKETVIFFSESNADFKKKTKDGKSVLHLAIENSWYELVEVLIIKGADINDETFDGETSLYIAVEMGDDHMVELLLEYDADVNVKNLKDQSPLHVAVEFSIEIVKLLLGKGAYINEVDKENETPLSIAIKHKNLEIIEELLQYNPSTYNSSNKTAFLFALKNEDFSYLPVVSLLLQYGFTIKTEDLNKTNLLYNLVSQGHFKLVKQLLEEGVDISFNSEKQQNHLLLHKAVLCKNLEMAALLIKYKCNLNAIDDYGQTPVGYAIEHRNLKMLDLLLTSGAIIQNDAYPLLTAAKEGDILLMQILLKYGADINISDKFGTTALHFATWNKWHLRSINFLLNKKAIINTTEKGLNDLQENSTNNQENDSYTKNFKKQVYTSPFHIAVNKKNINVSVALLEHHANINSKDGLGRTALHIASAIKSPTQKKMIETLINYGANINVLDDFKRLPFYYVHNQTCICSIAFQNEYELYSECECDLYEDCIDDISAVFVKHIALLISMNKFVHMDNLKIISSNEFSENLRISCFFEIENMKEEKICDHISLYDILTKKSSNLIAYVRNEDIVQAFESSGYENKFPLYYETLKDRMDSATGRKCLLEEAIFCFNFLLKFELPEVIVEKIFESLHLQDLSNIIAINQHNYRSSTSYNNPVKRLKIYR